MNTRIARAAINCLLTSVTLSMPCLIAHAQADQQTLYVTNFYSGAIDTVSPDGTVKLFVNSPYTAGAAQPAFDDNNNLYVGTGVGGNHDVAKITPDKTVSVFVSNLGFPTGIAFYKGKSNPGIFYVSNAADDTIYKVTPGGTATPFVSGLPQNLQYLTVDNKGNIYSSSNSFGAIDKITPAGLVIPIASGLGITEQLVFDPKNGDLYVAGLFIHGIYQIAPDGTVSTFASGLPYLPTGLAISNNYEDLYVGCFVDGTTSDPLIFKVPISDPGQWTPFAASPLFDGINGLTSAPAPVPEPGTLALLGGLLIVGSFSFRQASPSLRKRAVSPSRNLS